MKKDHHPHPHKADDSAAPPARDFLYIDTADALADFVSAIRGKIAAGAPARCCIDTEADSLHHYQEKLCLIQIAFGDLLALVDPLAIADMSPLIAVLDECQIWLHGADYDLTLLRKTYGWSPREICDTQIAARLVGSRQFGLAALLESTFGASHSKASQKADWSRRPLPAEMLRYAVDDVRLLLPLADHLMTKLREAERTEWFLQSCRSLQKLVASRPTEPREDPWRVQGSGRLHPKGLALLKGFWEWRETVAAERDIPCFRVMSNKQMLDYAVLFEGGHKINPPNGWRTKWKKDFFAIKTAVAESDPQSWPQRIRKPSKRLSDRALQQVEDLCKLRDARADALGIESSLIGSRFTLEQVVASGNGAAELLPWQTDLLAEGLAALKSPVA